MILQVSKRPLFGQIKTWARFFNLSNWIKFNTSDKTPVLSASVLTINHFLILPQVRPFLKLTKNNLNWFCAIHFLAKIIGGKLTDWSFINETLESIFFLPLTWTLNAWGDSLAKSAWSGFKADFATEIWSPRSMRSQQTWPRWEIENLCTTERRSTWFFQLISESLCKWNVKLFILMLRRCTWICLPW